MHRCHQFQHQHSAVLFLHDRIITECGQAHEKRAAFFALHEQNVSSMQQISQLPAATDLLVGLAAPELLDRHSIESRLVWCAIA